MELPDLANLTLVQVLATLLFFTAIDTGSAYIIAAMNHNFQSAYALDFLRTHVAKVAGPVTFLGVIGKGVEPWVPAIPFAFPMAIGILGVYILTVIASVRDSWADKAIAPTPTSAIAPIVDSAAPPVQGDGAV